MQFKVASEVRRCCGMLSSPFGKLSPFVPAYCLAVVIGGEPGSTPSRTTCTSTSGTSHQNDPYLYAFPDIDCIEAQNAVQH